MIQYDPDMTQEDLATFEAQEQEYRDAMAMDAEMNHRWEECHKPIAVMDTDGSNVVAYIVFEYDPGEPDVPYLSNGDPGYPGTPGYAYWRFATLAEIDAIRTAQKVEA